MFDSLPSIWHREEPTEREKKFSQNLLWGALSLSGLAMIIQTVTNLLHRTAR